MSDDGKGQEGKTEPIAGEEIEKVVETVGASGTETPAADESTEAAREEKPNSSPIGKDNSDQPSAEDHPLGASGEDDYHSADDDAGLKSAESETPEIPKTDENVTQNGGTDPAAEKKAVDNDETASTSSKDSESKILGRRRRSASESDDHESKTGKSDQEKDEVSDDEELDPQLADDQGSGNDEDAHALQDKIEEREDRQNPAFVPRRGNFFQHDMRIFDEPEKPAAKQSKKQIMIEKQNRWQHDMFDEREQMPKSRHELVNSYGYDIRHETRAPRDPHGRRYGRSQNVERDWRDPDSYGRRSFGGYRRSFGGGGGRGRGHRGGGGGGGHRNQKEQTVEQSRSVSPRRKESGEVETKRVNDGSNRASTEGVVRSRSFSGDERRYDDGKPRGINRGGHYGGGMGSGYQRTYGTVEFRRRGRGTAFNSNQKGSYGGGGRYYDGGTEQKMSRRSAEADFDQSSYNDNNRGGRQSNAQFSQQRQSYQAPPRFQQHHQGQRRGAPFAMTNAPFRRSQEHEYNDSNEVGVDNRPPELQQQPFSNTQQQTRNQERSNPGAKRYSAIRQQAHQQPNMVPSAPATAPQGGMANSVQQGGVIPTMPLVMPTGPPANAAPVTMMVPPVMEPPAAYPPSYPPYYNGSGMYQQAAPVSVPEMYPVPGTYGDGSAPFVLPQAPPRVPAQAFMGQQQYPPAYSINQPIPHYSAESRDAYAAAGGGAVYFDPGSQHRSQRYTAQETKRRPKGIPIVSPEQAAGKGERTVDTAAEQ